MLSAVPKQRASPALSGIDWISWTCFILIAGAVGNVAFVTALNFAGPQPFHGVVDDSLMLVRYADNVLKYGAIIWNPGGPPTYGLTSPYYFLCVVMPVRELIASSPIGVAVCSSLLSGLFFFCAVPTLIYGFIPGEKLYKHVAMAAVFISIAWSAHDVVGHLISGMDACFGLLYFTVYLVLLSWHSMKGTEPAAILAGVIGGLSFGARPDLLIYALVIPMVWLFFCKTTRERRTVLFMFVATVFTVSAQVGLANSYFHSPLPLSFYAKSLKLYPGLVGYKVTSLYSLWFFIASYWLLLILIALDAIVGVEKWWRKTSPLDKGVLAALLLHLLYVLFGVIPIMGQHQRFYYADLPALIYLSSRAIIRLSDRLPRSALDTLSGVAPKYRYVAFAAAFFFPLPIVPNVQTVTYLLSRNFASFDLVSEYRAYDTPYWFALDRFSSLPNDLKMAATEIGHVAAMNLDKEVVDFSGLNETRFAHHRFSAETFFQYYRPDLIFMPHPGYRGMVQELENNPVFRTEYLWIPQEATGDMGTGIALRRNSRYFPAMHSIVNEACAGVPCKLP